MKQSSNQQTNPSSKGKTEAAMVAAQAKRAAFIGGAHREMCYTIDGLVDPSTELPFVVMERCDGEQRILDADFRFAFVDHATYAQWINGLEQSAKMSPVKSLVQRCSQTTTDVVDSFLPHSLLQRLAQWLFEGETGLFTMNFVSPTMLRLLQSISVNILDGAIAIADSDNFLVAMQRVIPPRLILWFTYCHVGSDEAMEHLTSLHPDPLFKHTGVRYHQAMNTVSQALVIKFTPPPGGTYPIRPEGVLETRGTLYSRDAILRLLSSTTVRD